MGLADIARLGFLLKRLSSPPSDGPPKGVIERLDLRTSSGMAYDRYLPRRPPRLCAVAVHGVTLCGKGHTDLVHFARCLAATGIDCYAPTLPGLSEMSFDPRDIDALSELVSEVAGEGGRRVVMMGFCYGASYSLLTSARPEVAPHVRSVLAFGGYHKLETVVDGYQRADRAMPADEEALDDRIYLDMMLAYRHRQKLGLPAEATNELEGLLRRYCHDVSLEEKRRFHERHLATLDLLATDRQWLDRTSFDALSPAGNLASIDCDVGLVHDPSDRLVPASEARRLHRELESLPGGGRQELLVSNLMSHVTLSDALKLGDASRLLRMLVPLVRGETDEPRTNPRDRTAPTPS